MTTPNKANSADAKNRAADFERWATQIRKLKLRGNGIVTKDEEANIGLDEYRRRFREAVNNNKDIEALENETNDKARMFDDKGEYKAAAEFYLLVEEISKALGKSRSYCNYARESAADASSKAKNWSYAGMLYRGVV